MSKTSPTIYDVAALAGVSISTVSKVLNDPEKVSGETRAVVMKTIEKMRFVPRAEARARALKATRRIGVLSPFFTAPSFVQRLRGVAAGLRDSNHELIIYTVDSAQKLKNYLETLPLTHNLEGLIILSLQFDNKYARQLVEAKLEAVLVEYPHQDLSSVEIDDIAGGRMAAEYLYNKGYRRLGFAGDTLIPEFGIHPITKRLQGFRQGLAELNCNLRDEDVLLVQYDLETTLQNALNFLKRPDRPTAIFAATDLQAIGIIKAARELGLRVPQDLAVMGFDDLDVAELVGLTTICQHLDESGRVAAELLLSRLGDNSRTVQHIKLPLKIIERDTV
jgi:DNA-binding LacI/PurR family transcriptional regulator